MLSREHLADAELKIKDAWSGFDAPNEIRRWISIAEPDQGKDKSIHVRFGNRYYRLAQNANNDIGVEGFVGWPIESAPGYENDFSRPSPSLFPEHMTPISMNELGIIFSRRQRVSPHDERLGVLVHDLSLGTTIPEETYLLEKVRVDDHK